MLCAFDGAYFCLIWLYCPYCLHAVCQLYQSLFIIKLFYLIHHVTKQDSTHADTDTDNL